MTTLWIIIGIFVLFAILYGATQLVAAIADRRHAREVVHDEARLHPDDEKRS